MITPHFFIKESSVKAGELFYSSKAIKMLIDFKTGFLKIFTRSGWSRMYRKIPIFASLIGKIKEVP